MKNILVSGASGIVGYGILRSLRNSGRHLNLIGATIYLDSPAQGFCDIFEQAIPTNDDAYIDWLCETIRKHKIDLLFPGIEADMYAWSKNISVIESTGAKVLMNNPKLLDLCIDKWKFYEYLKRYDTDYLIESTLDDDFDRLEQKLGLPFLMKPRRGFGSKGIVKVLSRERFDVHKEAVGETLMAQTIVGNEDEEYTTSAFCDGEGGYYAYMTLKRKLSTDGFTDKAVVENVIGMEQALKTLCDIFKPIGPTNFQFRLHEGNLKLLEINPRISSSTSIRTAFGYNESLMAVEYFLNEQEPVQPLIREGRAVRYMEDLIFYK